MIGLKDRTVFVTGAGFTKAFLPEAPLLEDKYDFSKIKTVFGDFTHATQILEKEIQYSKEGVINLERLMTRLQGGMPYDSEQGVDTELRLLLSEVKKVFFEKLEKAKEGTYFKNDLGNLAQLCVKKRINVITFNYDDLFDAALWNVKKITGISPGVDYWHPDGGYGFFCPPSDVSVAISSIIMDKTAMSLLKLHGSANWKIRKGHKTPYSIDAICHHDSWSIHMVDRQDIPMSSVEAHLEPESFIVPPILTKESLVQEPILRLTWSKAYEILKDAELVVFIGYSFPITDFASRFLFSEAIQGDCSILVINFTQSSYEQRKIRGNYRQIFPKLGGNHFYFKGALEWSRGLVDKYSRINS